MSSQPESIGGQLELAAWEHELRDSRGRWAEEPDVTWPSPGEWSKDSAGALPRSQQERNAAREQEAAQWQQTRQAAGTDIPRTEYGQGSEPVRELRKLFYNGDLTNGDAKPEDQPDQGAQGVTEIVTLPGGGKVVFKSQEPERNDREELSYYVSQALAKATGHGSGLPPIARNPDTPWEMVERVVPGTVAFRYFQSKGDPKWDVDDYRWDVMVEKVADTWNGHNIGLLDYVTSNSDRNPANYLVDDRGSPAPIDMGMAQFDGDDYGSPFWSELHYSPAEVTRMEAELRKLRPEFQRLGHEDWHVVMMDAVSRLQSSPPRFAGRGDAISLAVQLGFDPAEPRDTEGKWISLYHGTTQKAAQSIQQGGLTSASYVVYENGMPESPNLTPDRQEALTAAHDFHVPLDQRAAVVEVRIPRELEHEYLHPAFGHMGYRALRKPLPPSMIHSVQAEQQSPMEEFNARNHSNTQPAVELATGTAWLHELRDSDGKWTRTPGDNPGTGLDRYKVPPHERLVNPHADFPDPADMPYFRKHPVSADNIIHAYDAVPREMRPDGMRWYADAHLLSRALAHGNAEEGAILLANYSPQANWPINMFRAARVADEGKPIPAGQGYISGDQVKKAQKALDGQHIDEVLVSPKTRSFAHLLAQGDDSPDDPYGHVVIDAHALNVAEGGTQRGATYKSDKTRKKIPKEDLPPISSDVRAHEYVGDMYRQAASYISHRDGVLIKPHQLQAVTWVAQVLTNQAEDRAAMGGATGGVLGRAKGRLSARAKDWIRWLAYAQEHHLQLIPGVSALAAQALFAQVIEMAGEDSIIAQLGLATWAHEIDGAGIGEQMDLAFNPTELRDRRGKWTDGLKPLDPYYNELPESGHRGTVRSKGTFNGPTGRETEDAARVRAYRRQHPVAKPITADQARGNSRPVSYDQFQELAARGLNQLAALSGSTGHDGLTQHWDGIKAATYAKVREPWGGATIDTVTGTPLESDADRYALSVKPKGLDPVSVPEHASEAEFGVAMDRALAQFGDELDKRQRYLGVFHDDDHARIDIDPVLVVDTPSEVETIGAFTHAVGGAYHFASGNGFWPPHVADDGVQ